MWVDGEGRVRLGRNPGRPTTQQKYDARRAGISRSEDDRLARQADARRSGQGKTPTKMTPDERHAHGHHVRRTWTGRVIGTDKASHQVRQQEAQDAARGRKRERRARAGQAARNALWGDPKRSLFYWK